MNSKRRKLVTELVRDLGYSKKLAYLATKGVKGHRKELSQASIWQKLKAIKRLGQQQKSEEVKNENPTNT